jgi:cyclic pyranopterin phosphate synthase
MTTNGFFLFDKVDRLVQAGLKRINVSLDSLQPARFERMVRRDGQLVFKILEGMRRARTAGLSPIKVNCVVMRGYNDDELLDFVRLGRKRTRFVSSVHAARRGASGICRQSSPVRRSGPDRRVSLLRVRAARAGDRLPLADGRGSIRVIASVTEPFCDHCNRVRITADGHLRTCLFALTEHNLKGLLRSGATDEELADFIIAAVWKKEAGHKINQPDFVRPDRSMSAIGG